MNGTLTITDFPPHAIGGCAVECVLAASRHRNRASMRRSPQRARVHRVRDVERPRALNRSTRRGRHRAHRVKRAQRARARRLDDGQERRERQSREVLARRPRVRSARALALERGARPRGALARARRVVVAVVVRARRDASQRVDANERRHRRDGEWRHVRRASEARMAPTTAETRARPFILVTGVPGAGKTTLADALATRIDAKRIDVGALCAREGFHGAYVEDADTHELDEDALLDRMEDLLEGHAARGEACVVDYHSCELFPERWFDLVTCLTLVDDTATLYDRLAARGVLGKEDTGKCGVRHLSSRRGGGEGGVRGGLGASERGRGRDGGDGGGNRGVVRAQADFGGKVEYGGMNPRTMIIFIHFVRGTRRRSFGHANAHGRHELRAGVFVGVDALRLKRPHRTPFATD